MKKEYSSRAKSIATGYALANLCLHILLLVVIIQCVWLAKMGVHSFAAAKAHIFLPIPAYKSMVEFVLAKPSWVGFLNPYVWPYVFYVALVLVGNGIFSFKASRVLKRGRVDCPSAPST